MPARRPSGGLARRLPGGLARRLPGGLARRLPGGLKFMEGSVTLKRLPRAKARGHLSGE